MDNTASGDSTRKHSSPDIKPASSDDSQNNIKASAERSFTRDQVFIAFGILAFFSFLPVIVSIARYQQIHIFKHWIDLTAGHSKKDNPDVLGLLANLATLQAALFAITVFRDTYSSNGNARRRDEYNHRHRKDAINVAIIFLTVISQVLLTIEAPRLCAGLGDIPGIMLAVVFFLVNMIALLSVFDFAATVDNAHDTAEEKINQYKVWKDQQQKADQSRKAERFSKKMLRKAKQFSKKMMRKAKQFPKKMGKIQKQQRALCKAMFLPFMINIPYLILTCLPFLKGAADAADWRQLACDAFLIIFIAWVLSGIVTPWLLSEYLSATCATVKPKTSEKPKIFDKVFAKLTVIVPAADVWAAQTTVTVFIGVRALEAPTWGAAIPQILAVFVAFANVLIFCFAWPHSLMRPYLIEVCEKEIEKQEKNLEKSEQVFEDAGTRNNTDTVDNAAQTPASGQE